MAKKKINKRRKEGKRGRKRKKESVTITVTNVSFFWEGEERDWRKTLRRKVFTRRRGYNRGKFQPQCTFALACFLHLNIATGTVSNTDVNLSLLSVRIQLHLNACTHCGSLAIEFIRVKKFESEIKVRIKSCNHRYTD